MIWTKFAGSKFLKSVKNLADQKFYRNNFLSKHFYFKIIKEEKKNGIYDYLGDTAFPVFRYCTRLQSSRVDATYQTHWVIESTGLMNRFSRTEIKIQKMCINFETGECAFQNL